LIYNVRKSEQDQTAIFRQFWRYAGEDEDGLFDNPNGRNATWATAIPGEKKMMYGQDKMCLGGEHLKGISKRGDGASEARPGCGVCQTHPT
jgi:hypothetical protein